MGKINKRLRILYSSSSYAPARNGQAVFATNLAEGMARRGHDVWLLMPSDKGSPYETIRNGVQIQAVSALDLGFLHNEAFGSFFPDAEVRRFFKVHPPEIVHVHEHHPLSNSSVKAARRLGIKVLGTNHFMPENLAPYIPLLPKFKKTFNRVLWYWMQWVYNSLDLVTAPSRTAAEIMKKEGVQAPILPISCGVKLDHFHPMKEIDRDAVRRKYHLEPGKTTFLFVGRVDAEKRLDILIRALKMSGRTDIQLAIAGIGAALTEYQMLVSELGLEDLVRFTGFVADEDLPALLNSIDIFAMPSEAELLSIASLEAMACAKPLLLARSKALPELVEDGLNGWLFNPGDVPDAAVKMAWFADQSCRWPVMGASSLEKVLPHGLEAVLDRYEELYLNYLT